MRLVLNDEQKCSGVLIQYYWVQLGIQLWVLIWVTVLQFVYYQVNELHRVFIKHRSFLWFRRPPLPCTVFPATHWRSTRNRSLDSAPFISPIKAINRIDSGRSISECGSDLVAKGTECAERTWRPVFDFGIQKKKKRNPLICHSQFHSRFNAEAYYQSIDWPLPLALRQGENLK